MSLTSTFPPTAGNHLENISRFLPGQRLPLCFKAAGVTMFSDTTNGGGRPVLPFQLSSLCFLAVTPPYTGGEGISSHWSQEREVTGFAWLNHHKPKGFFSAHWELLTGCLICSEKKSKTKKQTPSPRSSSTQGKAGVSPDPGKTKGKGWGRRWHLDGKFPSQHKRTSLEKTRRGPALVALQVWMLCVKYGIAFMLWGGQGWLEGIWFWQILTV